MCDQDLLTNKFTFGTVIFDFIIPWSAGVYVLSFEETTVCDKDDGDVVMMMVLTDCAIHGGDVSQL